MSSNKDHLSLHSGSLWRHRWMQSIYWPNSSKIGEEGGGWSAQGLLIFLKPSKLVLFDKNGIYDLFTQNYLLPKYVSSYFKKFKVFTKGERLTFRTVYINIFSKIICYEIWCDKLRKYFLFLIFPSLAIPNWKIWLKTIKQIMIALKYILLRRDWHLV